MMRQFQILLVAIALSACVSFPGAPEEIAPPVLAGNFVQSVDGALLGLQKWQAEQPRAIIIAVHGMNDYSNAFAMAGAWWAEQESITTYAIDLRGFGRSPAFGHWPGEETMIADLRATIAAVRDRHADLPVFVLGHSMGAGLVMAAEAEATLSVDGLILAAPGIWGGDALPWTHKLAANIAASLAPGKRLTGERTGRQSTDNIDALRAMYHDPLVIKATRLDAVLGVVRLMGSANGAADDIEKNVLVLIGEKDEIIPVDAQVEIATDMSGHVTVKKYPDGWHLLLLDLQREVVFRDIADWIFAAPQRANAAG